MKNNTSNFTAINTEHCALINIVYGLDDSKGACNAPVLSFFPKQID